MILDGFPIGPKLLIDFVSPHQQAIRIFQTRLVSLHGALPF